METTNVCAMRGTCGSIGWFGQQLPCPYDGPPVVPDSSEQRDTLVSVCGAEFTSGPTCCTNEQVETLQSVLQQAEPLISSCPACRNNFRDFWCSFTCSPNQGSFLNISSTQTTSGGRTAVKSAEFYVGSEYGKGIYDSCKDIKFGPTNGYAMELIGGGAKNYQDFLEYLGQLRPGLGSPFQINFPRSPSPPSFTPLNPPPRSCSDANLANRCACIDCPSICPTLPEVLPPGDEPRCHVGLISCLTFILILTYGIAVFGFASGYGIMRRLRGRTRLGRIALPIAGGAETPTSGHIVGAPSLGTYHDDAISDSRQSLGRGASLLDPDGLQQRQYHLNTILRRSFYRLGYFCASNPFITLMLASIFIAFSNAGWRFFQIEKDPIRLWVSPSSQAKSQKQYFDDHFGPFYRAEQLFITKIPIEQEVPQSSVLSYDVLEWLFGVEKDIKSLTSPRGITLDDVCFKPGGETTPCVVQSISGWFEGGDLGPHNSSSWGKRLVDCASQPVICLPDYGQPLEPEFVLGGIDNGDYLNSQALVVSYVVNNSEDPVVLRRAEEWEVVLRSYLQDLSSRAPGEAGVHVAFSTEISLEEELNKSTNTDIKTVVVSYVLMFLYVSFTLGRGGGDDQRPAIYEFVTKWIGSRKSDMSLSSTASVFSVARGGRSILRRLFVHSKVILGFFALVLVMTSITSAVGIFSYFGVRVTLIIAEVIPFLVLAVGVDNVFLLVAELERQNSLHGPNAPQLPPSTSYGQFNLETPLSPSLRTRSINGLAHDHDGLLSSESYRGPDHTIQHQRSPSHPVSDGPLHLSAEDRIARTLAKIGPSLLMSTANQTVAFALGALVPMPAVRNFALYAALSVLVNAILQVTVFVSALSIDLKRVESDRVDCLPFIKLPGRIALPDQLSAPGGILSQFFRKVYAPFLSHPLVKGVVLASFGGIAVLSVITSQHIQLGLDQRLALPSDSYLVGYFDALEQYLEFGPPVYFIASDIDIASRPSQRALCSRFTTCQPLSLSNTLEAERKRPEASFLAQPPSVWIDEFLRWLDPAVDSCCRVRKRDPSVFCRAGEPEGLCRPCLLGNEPAWNITMAGFPEGGEFERYLGQWLESPTNDECPLGGREAYKSALSIDSATGMVSASHFRTYHTPLRTQADFINAYAAARRVADDISTRIGETIFPYSKFYIFFEQYATIVGTTQEILGLGFAAVLGISTLLLGSWRAGSIVTTVVGLTVLSVIGVMSIWGISLNAISLVNLVISLGIAVEFCSHIARGYMSLASSSSPSLDGPPGQKERDERVFKTLVDVGPSVLSGITFTKLIGILILGFTRSHLLEIYYFRMWLSLIILGALHGLVLLPVLLSLFGGAGYSIDDEDEEWMSSAIRRHDYEYTPFLADSDSVISQ